MSSWIRAFVLVSAAVGALLLAACGSESDDSPPIEVVGTAPPSDLMGVRISPPLAKPDVVLTDQNGNAFDLRQETDGYLTLVYVGYTHCPDVCPTHMADIAAALKQVEPDVRERVKVVFITSDPERDTPEVLKRWLGLFDPSFIGLTGDKETIDRVQMALGMQPAGKQDLGNGEYAVNHAAYVIAFTPQDNVAYTVYPFGVTRETWVNDITLLVRKGVETSG